MNRDLVDALDRIASAMTNAIDRIIGNGMAIRISYGQSNSARTKYHIVRNIGVTRLALCDGGISIDKIWGFMDPRPRNLVLCQRCERSWENLGHENAKYELTA